MQHQLTPALDTLQVRPGLSSPLGSSTELQAHNQNSSNSSLRFTPSACIGMPPIMSDHHNIVNHLQPMNWTDDSGIEDEVGMELGSIDPIPFVSKPRYSSSSTRRSGGGRSSCSRRFESIMAQMHRLQQKQDWLLAEQQRQIASLRQELTETHEKLFAKQAEHERLLKKLVGNEMTDEEDKADEEDMMNVMEIKEKVVGEDTMETVAVSDSIAARKSKGKRPIKSILKKGDNESVVSKSIVDPYGDKGRYTGSLAKSDGMPHGQGTMVYEGEDRVYEGDWKHGRWHGFGKAQFANGDAYEGEYQMDQRHGIGKYIWKDGRVYQGQFNEDRRHGRGTFHWPDGSIYEGDFADGLRQGQGNFTAADGSRYSGGWRSGKFHGFGSQSWQDGRVYSGEWSNGLKHGKGVETLVDGSIRHDGKWKDDEPVTQDTVGPAKRTSVTQPDAEEPPAKTIKLKSSKPKLKKKKST